MSRIEEIKNLNLYTSLVKEKKDLENLENYKNTAYFLLKNESYLFKNCTQKNLPNKTQENIQIHKHITNICLCMNKYDDEDIIVYKECIKKDCKYKINNICINKYHLKDVDKFCKNCIPEQYLKEQFKYEDKIYTLIKKEKKK